MAEIGVTLREARMRAGIDIAEVESRTKIRAKYLRALENEEWSLLPGTTFVKSFLRTYAETLGLDAKLLVEEYKFRHEPYEVGGSAAGRGANGRRAGRNRQRGAFEPPKRTGWIPLAVLVAIVAALLFAVYTVSQGEDESKGNETASTATTTDAAAEAAAAKQAAAQKRRERRAAARQVVRLRVTALGTSSTFVCITDASGKHVVNGRTLQPGDRTSVQRSKRFEVAIGAPRARVTDGSKRLPLRADAKNVIRYEITKGKQTRLRAGKGPSCS